MRKLIFGLILIFTLFLLWLNGKLYSENFTPIEKQNDIIRQLNFIGTELKTNNLGIKMQDIFPEGFVFTNALYGLSWCEIAAFDSTITLKDKALKEALLAYTEINSEKAKSIFDKQLIPENGIFYVGWKNYLLSKILTIDTTFTQYAQYKKTFSEQCEIIKFALSQSNTPYLQSYSNQSWPADMFAAMASLKNYDNIFGVTYEKEITEWIKNIKTKLDPITNLIPHKTNSQNGQTIEGARGSSISLIIRLLAEIDKAFAKEQFQIYKSNFVTTTFSLPSISEYPKGQTGKSDIDSGPVIFGAGFSGTIVSIGTFSKLGDIESAEKQYKTINAFGFGIKSREQKKYIFGFLPIADAFIAWGRATELNSLNTSKSTSSKWRINFHLISFLVLSLLWALYYSKTIISKWKR